MGLDGPGKSRMFRLTATPSIPPQRLDHVGDAVREQLRAASETGRVYHPASRPVRPRDDGRLHNP